jgi:hypothetical protein
MRSRGLRQVVGLASAAPSPSRTQSYGVPLELEAAQDAAPSIGSSSTSRRRTGHPGCASGLECDDGVCKPHHA